MNNRRLSVTVAVVVLFVCFGCKVGNKVKVKYKSSALIVNYYRTGAFSLFQTTGYRSRDVKYLGMQIDRIKDDGYYPLTPYFGADKFFEIAASKGDTAYNKVYKVYKVDNPYYQSFLLFPSAFSEVIESIDVVSDADWDEAHSAGTSLNDITKLSTDTYRYFIRAGYQGIKLQGQDKMLNEMTEEEGDLIMYEPSQLIFRSLPTISKSHLITVTIVLDDGREFVCQSRLEAK